MNKSKGMTLIELMIVVAIISVIAGIAIPAYTGYVKTSRFSEAQTIISAINLAQGEFFLENNTYFGPVANGGDFAAASNNIYATPATTNYFDFSVTNACGAFTTCYTVVATGKNDMAGETVTFNGPDGPFIY